MRFLSVFCLITNYFHKKSAPDQWRTISFKKADCIQSPCFCLNKIHRRHKVANCFYCRPQLLQDCSHCVWSPRRGKGGGRGEGMRHMDTPLFSLGEVLNSIFSTFDKVSFQTRCFARGVYVGGNTNIYSFLWFHVHHNPSKQRINMKRKVLT